ncbi:MAG: AI-2E family transporter [Lachnospiraceae bacterium]
MKWKIEKKYIRVGLLALTVIVLSILFNYVLEHEAQFAEFKSVIGGTMWPIIVGCILAYLQNPVLNFFEHYLFMPMGKVLFRRNEERQKKVSRGLGILCTLILFFVLVVGGLYLVIPQVYLSLSKIVTEAPNYYTKIAVWVESLDPDKSEVSKYLLMGFDRIYSQAITYLNEDILPNMDKIVAGITSGIVGGLKMVLNVVLSIIISVYVMTEKEILISVGKKLVFSIFSRKHANSVMKGVRYANQVFGGFINGKIIDSFLIGVICYAFMQIVGLDYAVLISIIVGITNIIPYFGPFIGAIPSILILLMMDFKQGLIFAIFVVVLQQVDGNIIGPLILGDRLRISSMWILFAILIGGGFFGVPGMILGAPCFACMYALVGTICKVKLTEKNLPVDTEAYYNIDYARLDSDAVVMRREKQDGSGSETEEECKTSEPEETREEAKNEDTKDT